MYNFMNLSVFPTSETKQVQDLSTLWSDLLTIICKHARIDFELDPSNLSI